MTRAISFTTATDAAFPVTTMVSLTDWTLGLATGTGAVVGPCATCAPCVVPEEEAPEGEVLDGDVLAGCAAAPSLEEVHHPLSKPKARTPRTNTTASETRAIRFRVRAGLMFIVSELRRPHGRAAILRTR